MIGNQAKINKTQNLSGKLLTFLTVEAHFSDRFSTPIANSDRSVLALTLKPTIVILGRLKLSPKRLHQELPNTSRRFRVAVSMLVVEEIILYPDCTIKCGSKYTQNQKE